MPLERAARGRLQENLTKMSITHSSFDPRALGDDDRALLQAVVVELHRVTERVAALEQSNRTTTITHPPGQARRRDPHAHRQTGWQPTRR